MAPPAKNTLLEIGRSLAITGILVVGSTVVLASRLEERVKANREAAEKDLAAAITVRRAEQAVIIQNVEAQKAVLKDMTEMLKTIANGQKLTQESVARLEERVSYLAKGQEDIKVQLNTFRK